VTATPKKDRESAPKGKVDTNLLTGSDAHTLGIEAIGAELRSAEAAQRALQARLEKLEQQSPTKRDLDGINQSLATLGQGLDSVKHDDGTHLPAHPIGLHPEGTTQAPGSSTPTNESGGGSMPEVIRPPQGAFDAFDRGTTLGSPASLGSKIPAAEPIKIHVYGDVPTQANKPPGTSDEIYLAAGSILHGVLLTGVDAPTGLESKRDPIPALMRIKSEAIMPNRFHLDVRECFLIFGATGDLSTERALMRAETLSCIRSDGGVIEVSVDAYALGDDGKAGIRGRLVSRNGSLVAKAALASFSEALSQVFRPVAIQGLVTSPSSSTQFQTPNTGEAFQAAGYAGFGGAMQRVSEMLVKLADQIVPFIEVDAARPVEAVLLKGVSLQIRSKQR
jgi:conjugal transfer pilus assembly protein TraB